MALLNRDTPALWWDEPAVFERLFGEGALRCSPGEIRGWVVGLEPDFSAANDIFRKEALGGAGALSRARDIEARLRLLVDSLPVAVAYVDKDERHRLSNRKYEEWFGQSAAIEGMTLREVMGEAAYAAIEGHARTVLSGEAAEAESVVACADGGVRCLRARYVPHWNGKASPEGCFLVFTDVSDTRRIEASERQHLQEIEHAARLASIGEMAGELTHELGQPLAAISNYMAVCARLLERGQTEELKKVVATIARQSKRALGLIHGFRRFLHRGAPERSVSDPVELVRRAIDLIQWEADARGVIVRLRAEAAIPPVYTEAALIEQVVLNLLRNALDALGQGGAEGKPIVVTTRAVDGGVEIAVEDQGCGLAPEVKARLFEPFFTTKPEGVGIGLVVCRRIIESHGGRLWAEDNPEGRGARFCFRLPSHAAPSSLERGACLPAMRDSEAAIAVRPQRRASD